MKRNIKLLLAAAIVVAAGAGGWIWKKGSDGNVSYREVKVERGDIDLSILATGTVQPENRLEIKPPIAGRVEQVLVQEGQKVRKGQLLAWMSSTERAALLDAARAKGPDEVKRWEELYRPTPVVAPISGMIILRNIESGQTFTATDSVLTMSDRLTVKAQVDETDIAQVKLNEPATIVLDAYPGQKFDAKVDQIAFDAKTVNNVTTYVVDVLPAEPPEFMRSGMTANVTFVIESKNDVLTVPNDAIRSGGKGSKDPKGAHDGEGGKRKKRSFVTVRTSSGDSLEREIETGLSDGRRTEVVSGLQEGETILAAQLKLKGPGDKGGGSPFNPMGNRGGGGARRSGGS